MSITDRVAEQLAQTQLTSPHFQRAGVLPDSNEIIEILDMVRGLIFPGYFNPTLDINGIRSALSRVESRLVPQLRAAGASRGVELDAEASAQAFISSFPKIQQSVLLDVEAGFEGDPAAETPAEIIFSYPGLYAIFVYRVAHELYNLKIPFIPRIMTEHAHSLTGVDIHAGARIGKRFFIDHATGVVIGETTVIGDNVKIYQGVTIGALSTRGGQSLRGKKRHPTIGNNVTIYSGATILGGETVIGDGATISGNAFITRSVEAGAKA